MILSFSISNYGSFREKATFHMEATVTKAKSQNVVNLAGENKSWQVLKSSLIYGANASGKTTIIRALQALCKEVAGDTKSIGGEDVSIYDPFILDEGYANAPSSMDVEFVANNIKYRYYVKFNSTQYLEERLDYYPNGKTRSNLFTRNTTSESLHEPKYVTGISAKMRPKFSVFPNKLILTKFLKDTPHAAILPAALFLSRIGFANSYSQSMQNTLWAEGREILKDDNYKRKLKRILGFVDLGITDFKLPDSAEFNNISFTHKTTLSSNNRTLLMGNESLGTSALFILGPKILQALENGTPLFVDEFDSAFHSFISDFIIKMFSSNKINPRNAQLVIVTHDISLMDESTLRRDQIWFTQKNSEGSSELFSLSDFEGVREDTPFAKWYMASKFGAVPSIDYIENLFDE